MPMEFVHAPVMAARCIEALAIRPGGTYVDATTGGGSHSELIAQRLCGGRLICFDRDADALEAAAQRLRPYSDRITFVKANFEDMAQELDALGLPTIDGVLYDLGVSSWQLDNPMRGFGYSHEGAPLDMRMDRQSGPTARDVVNGYSQQALRDILRDYGEERHAGLIAAAIVRRRRQAPIETTSELSEIVKSAMPAAARREKQHPAKRTFQAIRIEVNGELSAVEKGVGAGIDRLAPGGRAVTLSFQSLEDRIVKQLFARRAQGCVCPKHLPVCVCGGRPEIRLLFKGVVTADAAELSANPRARSAKMRAAEKL